MRKKIITAFLSTSLILTTCLAIPPQAIAKFDGKTVTKVVKTIGGGKNAPHGKGREAVQHLYQKAKEAYSKTGLSKKERLKQKTKLRNVTKAIGKKARGENHSQKAKS
jgi:hypothetical protein